MKVALIGARLNRYGFGSAIWNELSKHGYRVRAFSRESCDISKPDWIRSLDESYDIIVLNAFDHKKPEVQMKAFESLFKKYKSHSEVHLVAIGSMAHYFKKETDYEKEKFKLHEFLLSEGKNSLGYECKLLLFEPGTMDNLLSYFQHPFTYSTVDETARMLRIAIEMNQKFLHLAIRGNRKANIMPSEISNV